MVVGVLTIDLYIFDSHCLKDKRRVLKSVLQRAKDKFNVSIAEIEEQDSWKNAVLGVAFVSNQKAHANKIFSMLLNWLEEQKTAEILKVQMEFL